MFCRWTFDDRRNLAPHEEELCNLKGYEFILEPRFGIFVWPSRLSWDQFKGGGLCHISHQATLPVFPFETGVKRQCVYMYVRNYFCCI